MIEPLNLRLFIALWEHKPILMNIRFFTTALLFLTTLSPKAQELQFVKDIIPEGAGITIQDVAFSESFLFFVAMNPKNNSSELWRTDGTERGTIILQENISKTDVFGQHYISESYNNVVYYQATVVEEGNRDLWRTDGTPEGTYLLMDLEAGELRPAGFTQLNGGLYFSGRYFDDAGEMRRGLYKTDGSEGGTVFISPLSHCSSNENNNVEQAILFNNAIYWFYHNEPCLYKSNGTVEGTGLYFGEEDGLDIKHIFPTTDRFYFVKSNIYFQTDLCRSDGSSTGITNFSNTYQPQNLFAALQDKLLYTAANPDNGYTNDIWVASDADQSAALLYDFYTEEEGARIGNLQAFNNKVFFTASEYAEDASTNMITGTGTELWATDGTTAGTYLVKDINEGYASSNPGNIVIHNGKMYFLAKYEGYKYALFQSDGTTEGTFPYFELPNLAVAGAAPKDLQIHNNSFYLTMGSVFTGRELWRISLPVINSATENNTVLSGPKIIPNPFQETAIIQFDQDIPRDLQIRFFNSNGQLVNLAYQVQSDHIILNKNGLSKGFYFYQIYLNGQARHQGKLMIL